MRIEGNQLIANPDYVIIRVDNEVVMGEIVTLGMIHYLNGKKLKKPQEDSPDNYLEVTKSSVGFVDLPEEPEEVIDELNYLKY